MYWKLPQRSFFGRIEDTINCFRYLLTFRNVAGYPSWHVIYKLWIWGKPPTDSIQRTGLRIQISNWSVDCFKFIFLKPKSVSVTSGIGTATNTPLVLLTSRLAHIRLAASWQLPIFSGEVNELCALKNEGNLHSSFPAAFSFRVATQTPCVSWKKKYISICDMNGINYKIFIKVHWTF